MKSGQTVSASRWFHMVTFPTFSVNKWLKGLGKHGLPASSGTLQSRSTDTSLWV